MNFGNLCGPGQAKGLNDDCCDIFWLHEHRGMVRFPIGGIDRFHPRSGRPPGEDRQHTNASGIHFLSQGIRHRPQSVLRDGKLRCVSPGAQTQTRIYKDNLTFRSPQGRQEGLYEEERSTNIIAIEFVQLGARFGYAATPVASQTKNQNIQPPRTTSDISYEFAGVALDAEVCGTDPHGSCKLPGIPRHGMKIRNAATNQEKGTAPLRERERNGPADPTGCAGS